MTSCGVTLAPASRTVNVFWKSRPKPPFAGFSRRPRTLPLIAPARSSASRVFTGFAQLPSSRAISIASLPRSAEAPANPPDRQRGHVQPRTDRGALPDVLRLGPVPAPVDEDSLHRHGRGDAEVRRKSAESLPPDLVLRAMAVEREEQVVERIVRSDEGLHLRADA